MKAQRILRIVVIGAATAGVAFCTVNFMTAESRVRSLCEQIAPGMTLDTLQIFAQGNGLGPSPRGDGPRYLVESRTFGRFGCKVHIEAGTVKTASYHFAD